MTPKEAIKLLHPNTTKEAIRKIEENGGDAIKAVEEACFVACEALEKQIPKKPISVDDEIFGDSYECPVCGYNIGSYELDYCDKCGQKLKWGEDDDGEGEDQEGGEHSRLGAQTQ